MSSLRSSDPTGWRNEDKRRSNFARASAILFTVDITHMRARVSLTVRDTLERGI